MRESAIVIGGGLVGLATALALVRRGEPVVVCEKEPNYARHQSDNNSGVVHSGLYKFVADLRNEPTWHVDVASAHPRTYPFPVVGKIYAYQKGHQRRPDHEVHHDGEHDEAGDEQERGCGRSCQCEVTTRRHIGIISALTSPD